MVLSEEEATASSSAESTRLKLKSKSKNIQRERKENYYDYINGIENFNINDRSILNIYHCRIMCDKPEKELPEQYYNFVMA
jgi:hypothetical protein